MQRDPRDYSGGAKKSKKGLLGKAKPKTRPKTQVGNDEKEHLEGLGRCESKAFMGNTEIS